jgi:hypothetical protein
LGIGSGADAHLSAVGAAVEHLGFGFVIIDPSRSDSHLSIEIDTDGLRSRPGVSVGENWVTFDSVIGGFWWLKDTLRSYSGGDRNTSISSFVEREWITLLEALVRFTPGAMWINTPWGNRYAANKLGQLQVASNLEWAVPHTVVTNSRERALSFAEKAKLDGGEVIYKTMTTYFEPPDQFVYTNRVSMDTIRQEDGSIAIAPCEFQEEIVKESELRLTVIGDRLFPVLIDSQAREETRVDWRRDQSEVAYKVTDVNEDVTKKAIGMLKALRIQYGAIDAINTRSGKSIFLEINPMGQWLWLENKLHLDITSTIADRLVSYGDH